MKLAVLANINRFSLREPLIDFIKEIEKNVGVDAQMNMLDMQPGDVPKTFANSDLLKDLTGYRPSGNIQDGVKAFVDWNREYYKVGLNN